MITISDISARIAGRLLLDHASLSLPSGAKAGLVGRNGAGKSTLFRVITGDLGAESGTVSIPKNARSGQVAQEAPGTEESLISIVLFMLWGFSPVVLTLIYATFDRRVLAD